MTADSTGRDAFLQLLAPYESRLRAFMVGALASPEDRADLFQDVVLILWRKFDHYDSSRPFLPWAMGVAVRRLKEEYRRASRRPGLLEADHLERLANSLQAGVIESEGGETAEEAALAHCLAALPPRSAQLIQRRYYEGTDIGKLGGESGQSAAALYQNLSRLRRHLAECIRQRLRRDKIPSMSSAGPQPAHDDHRIPQRSIHEDRS